MRLLKTEPSAQGYAKLELVEKWGRDIPRYAILSHTWSRNADDEVHFADVRNGTSVDKSAFQKLRRSLEFAKQDGYAYLWCDTCCIDKSSSNELSESINSMYRYYEKADVCYAFLADVGTDSEDLGASRWWKRGWTLQELLAPIEVQFLSRDWTLLGNKANLRDRISQITGIAPEYLINSKLGGRSIHHASIAQRMSWAADRQTTREEDLAYCLMGVFQVNMPMLYGEGETKAFIRLQEEIMKSSEDHSIFAWIAPENSADHRCGMLAESPRCFKHTGSYVPYNELSDFKPPIITARGLQITLPLTLKADGTFFAALQCPVPARGYSDWLAVYLERIPSTVDQYTRINSSSLASCSALGRPQNVYIRQNFDTITQAIYPVHLFQIENMSFFTDRTDLANYRLVDYRTSAAKFSRQPAPVLWSWVPRVYSINKTAGTLTVALLAKREFDRETFILMLGSGAQFDVAFDAIEGANLGSFEQMQRAYSPKPIGQRIHLGLHVVSVKAQDRIVNGQKVYCIDVEIDPIPQPDTLADFVDEAIDIFRNPPTVVQPVRRRDRLGRLLKFAKNRV